MDETTTVLTEETTAQNEVVYYIQMFAEMMSQLFAYIKMFFEGLKG